MKPTVIERLGISRNALSGEIAVITGAGRGIGRATAVLFAEIGANVVAADVSDSGAETARAIRDAGGKAIFVKGDVSNEDDVLALAAETERAFGNATILVNNAIFCPVASVLEMDASAWDKVMAVNLRGAFLTCRAFLPGMMTRWRGTIVNMISADAIPYLSAYAASKLGLAAFSQSLAGEVGQTGVRVIAFGPGFVDTPGLREAAHGLAPRMGMDPDQFMGMSMHPAYKGAMPAEDVAAALAYLVSTVADEYHGDRTDGYAILERAGFFGPMGQPHERVEPSAPSKLASTDAQALELARRLQEAISETKAEFDRLPIFIRPMARGAFASKAGQAIQEWARTAFLLYDGLTKANGGDESALNDLREQSPRFKELLRKLAAYYKAVPGESSRFIKDPEAMKEIRRIMAEREELVLSLNRALDLLWRKS
ncbi:MAG: SDR family oxidoreductase [Firmicutes bacterium]|nr:SDR family oxidoreductase [Bacillota bacterium]